MASEQSKYVDDDHRVIKFRPRTLADPPKSVGEPHETHAAVPDELPKFERGYEPDDYRHRMRTNIAAGLFTVALIGFGIWLAMSIADLRRTQDCILLGRRDCAVIPTPAH